MKNIKYSQWIPDIYIDRLKKACERLKDPELRDVSKLISRIIRNWLDRNKGLWKDK